MRRKFVKVITWLSLLLCAATVATWIFSDAAPFQWEWTVTRGPQDSAWSRGQLCLGQGRIGYVTWTPASNALMRYMKPYRRFRKMTPDAFDYDHMLLFDPWAAGHWSMPAPLDAKNFWW